MRLATLLRSTLGDQVLGGGGAAEEVEQLLQPLGSAGEQQVAGGQDSRRRDPSAAAKAVSRTCEPDAQPWQAQRLSPGGRPSPGERPSRESALYREDTLYREAPFAGGAPFAGAAPPLGAPAPCPSRRASASRSVPAWPRPAWPWPAPSAPAWPAAPRAPWGRRPSSCSFAGSSCSPCLPRASRAKGGACRGAEPCRAGFVMETVRVGTCSGVRETLRRVSHTGRGSGPAPVRRWRAGRSRRRTSPRPSRRAGAGVPGPLSNAGNTAASFVSRPWSQQESDDRSDNAAHQGHSYVGARPSPAHDRCQASCPFYVQNVCRQVFVPRLPPEPPKQGDFALAPSGSLQASGATVSILSERRVSAATFETSG